MPEFVIKKFTMRRRNFWFVKLANMTSLLMNPKTILEV